MSSRFQRRPPPAPFHLSHDCVASLSLQLKTLLGKLLLVTSDYEHVDSFKVSVLEVSRALRCAFACLNRGFALDTLDYLVALMGRHERLRDALHLFLRVLLMSMPDYVSINMPAPCPFTTAAEFRAQSLKAHPLVALLLAQVEAEFESRSTAKPLLWLLLDMLSLHSRTLLLRSQPQHLSLVIEMYFPFVVFLLTSRERTLRAIENGGVNGQALFCCFLYILQVGGSRQSEHQNQGIVRAMIDAHLSILDALLLRLMTTININGKYFLPRAFLSGCATRSGRLRARPPFRHVWKCSCREAELV